MPQSKLNMAPATRGSKRSRRDFEADGDAVAPESSLGPPTPSASSRATTPSQELLLGKDEYKFIDDPRRDDIQWIMLPKKRNFGLFPFHEGMPEHRKTKGTNAAELPLAAVRHDGQRVTMWAKMDTGADVNTINYSTVEILFGDKAKSHLRTMSTKEFGLMANHHFKATKSVDLDFVAGMSKRQFTNVPFIVIPKSAVPHPDTDGIPNVLLGLPFLHQEHMIQIDLEFCNAAEPGLPVIAGEPSKEREGSAGIFTDSVRGIKNVRGFDTKPTKPRGK